MSTIEKIAVYDARIIQEAPKYGVQKGALAVSVSPFNALSATANNMTFQVLVPSLNVFVDRKVDLITGANVYAEAVPSQYTNVGYSNTAAPATSLESAYSLIVNTVSGTATVTTATVVDPVCPSANAMMVLEQSQLGSAVTDSIGNLTITGGSKISGGTSGFAVGSIALSQFTVTAISSLATFTATWTGGVCPAIPAARTYMTDFLVAQLTGSSTFTAASAAQTVAITQVGAANSFLFTFSSNVTTNVTVGDIVFVGNKAVISDTFTAETVVPFVAHNLNGAQTLSANYLRVYTNYATTGATPWATWGGFAKFTAAYSLVTDPGYIALPQLESTSQSLQLPREILPPAGTRGYGVNSGFKLERGSFAGCTGATETNWYQPIGGPQDVTLGLFPVQSLLNNMVAQVNDCSVNINGDVLKEMILLAQTRSSLMQRTTNSKFDVYSWTIDDVRLPNGATQTYGNAKDSDIGNGSWNIEYINPTTGIPLPRFGFYTYGGIDVFVLNYKPVFIPIGSTLVGKTIATGKVIAASSTAVPLPVMFRYHASEPLCISPFLWQDAKEMTECGIYGCTNIQFILSLQPAGPTIGYQKAASIVDGKRLYADKLNNLYPTSANIMKASGLHALFGKIALQAPTQSPTNLTGPWIQPRVMVTFLTPPPDVTLPLVSTVPYVEFPRYFSPASLDKGGQNSTFFISSNTVTLSSIPDLLAVFVKPTVRGVTQNEAYIPIEQIGVTFDNYSNLCSNFLQEDLYACTAAAGLDMDWQQFRGYTTTQVTTGLPAPSNGSDTTFCDLRESTQATQLSGGPLLLRMGQDIPLSPGLAPGTLGNFSVQLNLRLDNRHGFFNYLTEFSQSNNATIIIMAVNSGFFETVRGQSAVRKTILNSVDVEAASTQAGITSTHLKRLIGGEAGIQTSSSVDRGMAPVASVNGDGYGAAADSGRLM